MELRTKLTTFGRWQIWIPPISCWGGDKFVDEMVRRTSKVRDCYRVTRSNYTTAGLNEDYLAGCQSVPSFDGTEEFRRRQTCPRGSRRLAMSYVASLHLVTSC